MNKLKIATYVVCGVYAIVCIVTYFVLDYEPISDCANYCNYAYDCFRHGEYYPMRKHLYSDYLFAPGFVNFLILQLKFFGTLKYNSIFNILMNLGIMAELFYIGKNLFSERTAYLSVIFYCLMYSTWISIIPELTEVPFLFVSLTAICLCLSSRLLLLAVAGICLALGNWIRPLSVIFVPAILLLMYRNKCQRKHYTTFFAIMITCVLVIGSLTYHKIGHFSFQSSTSGYNLLPVANDKAALNYRNDKLGGFSKEVLHLNNMDTIPFFDRDSIWRAQAIDWIKENPTQYFRMYLHRIIALYYNDTGMKYFIIKRDNSSQSFSMRILRNISYWIIITLFLVTVAKKRKEICSAKGILLTVLLLGTCVTCLFHTTSRYHHPFLFVVILWAAYGVDSFLESKNKKQIFMKR